MDDAFDRAYRRGIYEELPPPAAPSTHRERRDPRPPAGAEAPRAFALKGAVLTPDAAWSEGYVVVEGGQVAAVQQNAPSDVDVLDTGGVILPGLIDLHRHPRVQRVRRLGAAGPVSEPVPLAGKRHLSRAGP